MLLNLSKTSKQTGCWNPHTQAYAPHTSKCMWASLRASECLPKTFLKIYIEIRVVDATKPWLMCDDCIFGVMIAPAIHIISLMLQQQTTTPMITNNTSKLPCCLRVLLFLLLLLDDGHVLIEFAFELVREQSIMSLLPRIFRLPSLLLVLMRMMRF